MVTFNRTKSLVKVVMTLVVVLAISACSDWFQVGLGDAVDVTAPRLTIESPSNEDVIYSNTDITFSGTVEDDIGVSKVVISYPGGTRNASISGNDWTVTVPFDTIDQRGRVIFNVIGYDTASPPKETNTATREIIVDDTAPTVLVKAPSEYSPSPEHSGYVVIEGETYDNDSPINTVIVEIYDDTATLVASQTADGDYSWSTRINFNDTFDGLPGFPAGSTVLEEYRFKVIVTDEAGNTNTYAYHASDFWSEWDRLASGTLFPAMKEIGLWDQNDENSLVTQLTDETTGDVIFPVADNSNYRHDFTETSSINLVFTRNENKDIPSLALSNLSTGAMGSIGEDVPILASATDDKEGIKQDSLVLYIYTDSDRTSLLETITAANINAPGDGLYCSFEYPLSVPTGVYYATMNAEDKKGTANSLNFSFLVDKGAPRITDITPASTYASLNTSSNTVITVMSEDDNQNVTLSYSVIDLDSGSIYSGVSHTPTVTNNEITSGGVTSYQNEYEITISDPVPENFELTIQIDDFKGLRTTQSKSYTLDKETPVVIINNPIAGDPVSGTALTTTGTASDVTSAPNIVSVMLEQGASTSGWLTAKGNTEWSQAIDLSTFSEGAMTLYAKAEDIAGNESTPISVSFSYDKAAPGLDFGTRQALSYETASFSFAGTASDSNSVKTVEIFENKDDTGESLVETVAINAASGNWAFNKTVAADGSDDGEYLYRVVVTDIANKTKEDSRVIRIDTEAPVIDVSNLSDGDSVEIATFEIKGTTTDYSGLEKNASNKQIMEYNLNSAANWTEVEVSGSGSWSIPVNGLTEGAGNNIQLRATDRNGLVSAITSINFGLDLNPPALVVTDAATLNGSTVNSDITLTGTASDANGVSKIEYKASGIAWTTMEVSPGTAYSSSDASVINWTQLLTVDTDTYENSIQIRVTDSYNKTSTETLVITYDVTPPTISSGLADGDFVTTTSYTIKGGASDLLSGVAAVEYSENPDDPSPVWNPVVDTSSGAAFNSWECEVTGLAEGDNQKIAFRATDGIGLEKIIVINFGLDISDPALTVAEKDTYNGKWTNSSSISLSGSTSDINGIAKLQVSIDGGTSWGDGTTYDDVAVIAVDGSGNWNASNAVNITGLSQGLNNIVVRSTDNYGKTTDVEINLSVDTVKPDDPTFTTTALAYIENTLSIAGEATDPAPASEIAKAQYSFNGSDWFDLSGTAEWVKNIDVSNTGANLAEGRNQTIYIKTIDYAGNESNTISQTFHIDRNDPATGTTGSWGAAEYKTASGFSLGGTASDTNGLTSITVSGGGAAAPTVDTSTGVWSTTITPPGEGVNTVTVTVTDNCGRSTTEDVLYFYDASAPVLQITSPSANENVTGASYTVVGKVTDNLGNGVQSLEYRYSLDGGANWVDTDGATAGIQDWTAVPSIAYSWEVSGLDFSDSGTDGVRVLEVRATDGVWAGYVAESVTFYRDQTAPIVDETGINQSTQVYRNADFALSGTASDTLAGVSNIKEVRITATKDGSTEASVNYIDSDLSDGYNYPITLPGDSSLDGDWVYTITAYDNAGNNSSVARKVLIDETAPDAPTISTGANQYFADTIDIAGTANDATSGIDVVEYSLDYSNDLNDANDTWLTVTGADNWVGSNINISGIAVGDRTIYTRAKDNADNYSAITSLAYKIDRAAPSITPSDAMGPTVYQSGTFSITGTAGDDVNLSSLSASGGGVGSNSGTNASWNFSVTPSSPGLNTITLTASDDKGNTTSETIQYFYDANAPTLSNISLINGSSIVSSSITITGEASDTAGESGISVVQYDVDGANNWQDVNGTEAWNISLSLTEGAGHTVQFRATDISGKTTTGALLTFTVDTTAPIISDTNVDWDADFATTADIESVETNQPYSVNVPQFAYEFLVSDTIGISSVSMNIPGVGDITATDSGVDKNGYDAWRTSAIDLTLASEDIQKWTITVTDVSGHVTTTERTVLVDNTAPTLEHRTPNTTEYLNGEVTVKGGAQDETGGSGLAKVEYYVGADGSNSWVEITNNLYNWEIDFSDAGIGKIDTYANAPYASDANSDNVWDLPIRIRVTDAAGNVTTETVSDYVVQVYPDADKPLVTMIYPDPTETDTVLGGTIRIFGTATDDDAVDYVQVQIDVDNNGTYDNLDVDDSGVNWYNAGNGIEAVGSSAWNITINQNDEFHPDFLTSVDDKISIRARAVDVYGTPGPWSTPKEVQIDAAVPQISPLTLTQGSASKNYTAGMYINGTWYLNGTLTDDSAIASAQIDITMNGSTTSYTQANMTSDGSGGYSFNLEMATPDLSAGAITIDISATDDTSGSPKTSQVSYVLNYDNKAPVLSGSQLSGALISSGSMAGALDIEQSNYSFELASSVEEDASGFERVAFFITREGGTTPRVFNLDGSKGQTALADTKEISNFTADYVPDVDENPATGTNDPFYRELYTSGTVAASGDDYTFTHASLAAPLVRKGGLIKLQGLYYTISDFTGTTITIKNAVLTTGSYDAEIPYALVVDNLITEGPVTRDGSNEITAITNDDGDGLIEGVQREGVTYNWTSNINTLAIPDGPIVIHWVAFDQAGNMSSDSMNGMVQNNRPRLATMRLGTDLDANTTIDSDEKTSVFDFGDTSSSKDGMSSVTTDVSSDFTAKEKSLIELEIVGGNGQLAYDLSDEANAIATNSNFAAQNGDGYYEIPLAVAELTTIGENSQVLDVTVWDSTEDTTKGTDSQFASLNVTILVDVIDEVAPTAAITPFHWTSETDNSLYDAENGNGRSNGHIELEGDLNVTTFDGSTSFLDTDPKVSGSISIRGTAYDDQRLTSLWMYIDNFGFTNTQARSTTADFDTNADGVNETLTNTYTQLATYSGGSWTGTNEWAANGWNFVVESDTINQNGHTIEWRLDWNTSKHTNVADLDQSIRIIAEDKRANPNASAESATQTSAGSTTPLYQMDIVPYITSVSTESTASGTDSGINDLNIRSASGQYSIKTGTTADFITVTGFNLNAASARVTQSDTPLTTSGTAATISTIAADPWTSIKLSNAIDRSGYLTIFSATSNIPTLNNYSDNATAYNIETNTTIKNDILNDDVYFNVFEVSDSGYDNGYYPNMILDTDDIPVFGYLDLSAANDLQVRRSKPGVYDIPMARGTVWDQMAMAKDDDGMYHMLSVHNRDRGQMSYFYNEFARMHSGSGSYSSNAGAGAPYWSGYDGDFYYDTRNNAMAFDNTNLGAFYSGRFQHPKMIASGESNSAGTAADIYTVYYDASDKEIMLRTFEVGQSVNTAATASYRMYDATYDGVNYDNIRTNIGETDRSTTDEVHRHGIINDTSDLLTPFFDFGLTADNRLIVVYYDSNNELVLRYSSAAISGDDPTATPTMSAKVTLGLEGSGEYVKMYVDGQDLHIASYNSLDGDIQYTRVANATDNGTRAIETVTIDQYRNVGWWPEIQFYNDSGTMKPVVSYYCSTESVDSIRMAMYTGDMTTIAAGVDNDGYVTGSWNSMTVPVNGRPRGGIPQFNRVNLAINSSGNPVVSYLADDIEWSELLAEQAD